MLGFFFLMVNLVFYCFKVVLNYMSIITNFEKKNNHHQKTKNHKFLEERKNNNTPSVNLFRRSLMLTHVRYPYTLWDNTVELDGHPILLSKHLSDSIWGNLYFLSSFHIKVVPCNFHLIM